MSGLDVRFTLDAENDFLRLFDVLIEHYVSAADRAHPAIAKALEMLKAFPFSCRKAVAVSGSPFLRERIILFGGSVFVALFEIEDPRIATILAVRHQREEGYHCPPPVRRSKPEITLLSE